jgi:2-keto-4-pentenoate hydratase/2-oxohepta-3-ene-1,7-dioic acid hydratase in catechol pathway
MRIVRFSQGRDVHLGVLRDDRIVPLRGDRWPTSTRAFIEANAHRSALAALTDEEVTSIPLADLQLLAPIDDPGKVVAIGLNYADHAAEGKVDVPAEPLVFAKFPSAIADPGAPITWSADVTSQVDFEAELAVVMARPARYVSPIDALQYVFGYTCLNDVSARDLQFGDGQWVRGKSLDSFCPLGPWIVTADEIPDPQQLAITCRVNGEVLQSASTADMFFGVADLISRLSRWFTLQPGDVVATGTPPGVGYFRDPRRLLLDGDEVVVAIEGIGELRNPVIVRSGTAAT